MSYATVGRYLGMYAIPQSNLNDRVYVPNQQHMLESVRPNNVPKEAKITEKYTDSPDQTAITTTTDPRVWGPPFWFSLHVSAAHYPVQPSKIVRERMKNRILAIPYEIPCAACRPHASAFIEKHRDSLDQIVSGRDSLGRFYVDFHNAVNRRYNKPEWTYEQAYKKYSGTTKVKYDA